MIVEVFTGQGFQTAYPGVYSEVKTAMPSQPQNAIGVLGLFSDAFSRLKPATPVLVTSRAALLAALPEWGKRYARAIFEPFADPVVGAPSAVYLVNAAPSTRAARTLEASSVDQLVLTSVPYGVDGNRLWFKLESGTNQGKKITFGLDGETWTKDDVGGDNVFGLRYTGSDYSTVAATIAPASGVTVAFTIADILSDGGGDTWTAVDDLVVKGAVTLTLDAAAGGAGITFTITGVDADGEAATEAIAFDSDDTEKTSTTIWTAITSIARTAGAWGAASGVSLDGAAFNLPVGTYDTVSKVLDAINAHSADNFGATDAIGDGATRKVADLDGATSTSIKSASYVYFKADLDALVRAIGNSEAEPALEPQWLPYVLASRAAGATKVPDNVTSPTYLLGGANGTADNTSWQAALDSTQEVDVNHIWAETTSSSTVALIKEHAKLRRGRWGSPALVHLATARKPSKATAKAAVLAFSPELGTVCPNAVTDYDENGKPTVYDPLYAALRLAAGYCGVRPGVPLFPKRMNVLGIEHGLDWSERNDGEEMVAAGLTLLRRAPGGTGFEVLRDVTTYRKGADVVLTTPSAVNAVDAVRVDVDRHMKWLVGQPAFDGTALAAKAALDARLDRHVREFRNLKRVVSTRVVVDGLKARCEIEAEPVLPITFVPITWTFSLSVDLAA